MTSLGFLFPPLPLHPWTLKAGLAGTLVDEPYSRGPPVLHTLRPQPWRISAICIN